LWACLETYSKDREEACLFILIAGKEKDLKDREEAAALFWGK
jgi:hypothetical protein